MSRIVQRNDGEAGISNAANGIASTTAALTAGEPIAAGDLLAQIDGGKVLWVADPATTTALTRPAFLAADAVNQHSLPAILPFAGSTPVGTPAMAVLANGNIAIAVAANGGANAGFAVFSVYSPQGALVYGPKASAQSVAVTPTVTRLSIVALTGGGFALAVANPTGNFPSVAVYDDLGALVGGPVALETVTNKAYTAELTALPAGGFAVGWYTTVSWQARLAFFNSLCVQQGATITMGTGTMQPTTLYFGEVLRLVTLSNGNVAAIWLIDYNTSYIWRAVYSPAGAVVAAPALTGIVGASIANTPLALQALPLTDGGLGIYFVVGIKNYLAKFTSAGVAVGAVITAATATTNPLIGRAIAIAGGGMLWSGSSSDSSTNGLTFWGVVDGAMAVSVPSTPMNIGGAADQGGFYTLPVQVANGEIVILVDKSKTDMYAVRFRLVDGIWRQIDTGTPLTIASYAFGDYYSYYAPAVSILPLSDAISTAGSSYVFFGFAAARLRIINEFVPRRSIVGVALTAAAANNALTAQVLGAVETRLPFAKTITLDQSAAAVPGQKLSIIGNRAILRGIQP